MKGKKVNNKEKVLSHFEDLASSGYWESLYLDNSYNFTVRRREIMKMISGLNYYSVVDLGCGTGDFADFFSKNKKQYLGIDNSKEMIIRAQARFSNALFQVDDVENLSLPSETFDLALAIGLIEYLVDPGKFIQETQRILNRSGYLVVQAPHLSSVHQINQITRTILYPLVIIRRYITKQPVVSHICYTESRLISLIKPYGFEHCATHYCNYEFPWPFYNLWSALCQRISERITKNKNRDKYRLLASNVIVLFRKL